ncbi:hypothetical protein F5Y19DRAFT_63892 [Xylariaceae sp. FL1651]|nr:hypothetical protein F5Y19DRAFT_63892 [Xylariaceae sp. FL1651]
MASQSLKQGRFIPPPPDTANGPSTETESVAGFDRRLLKRRNANVYEAVAGRVTTTLPIDDSDDERPRPKHHRRHAPDSRRDPTLAPEEVLFKRSGAPVRFAEKDIYHSHEGLCDGGRHILPDSDMLKAIHSYAGHFYGANVIDERSMDETALLAFGILLEETSREVLGKKGDLVFTEGIEFTGNAGSHGEDEDAEIFGFKDALKYQARGHIKR